MQIQIHNVFSTFECVICCDSSCKPPTKYKCTQCNQQICDDCYETHILTSNTCVFCRHELNIKKSISLTRFQQYRLYYYKGLIKLTVIILIWYIFLLTYLFIFSKVNWKK